MRADQKGKTVTYPPNIFKRGLVVPRHFFHREDLVISCSNIGRENEVLLKISFLKQSHYNGAAIY
jgi:hypothetical protein